VRRIFRASLIMTLAISVPSCTLLALAGPWILRVFFGKSLHAPLSLLLVLGAWGILSAVSGPMAMLLNGAGVLKQQAIIAVVASTANLTLSIFLTRRVGVAGVCLGSIITQVVIAIPLCWLVIRNLLGRLAKTNRGRGLEFEAPPSPAI
jgi:O-antigen/teichoic acid export membrane protein